MARQYVTLGVGGTITCKTHRTPTSATVAVYDSNGTLMTGPSAVTSLGVSTTCDASSGYGQADQTYLAVTATTGITVGMRVRVIDATGRSDVSTVIGVVAGAGLYLGTPLLRAYVATDVVHAGLEVSAAITTTGIFTAAQSLCRARWTITYGPGDVVAVDTIFDITSSPVTQPITVETLPSADPMALSQLPSSLPDWGPILERAWDRLLGELESAGLYPNHIVGHDQLTHLHKIVFRLELAEMGIEPSAKYITGGAIAYFASEMSAQISRLKIRWSDMDGDLHPSPDEQSKPRRVRVVY